MGVPAFYKWLVTKYPKVVANAIQDPSLDASSPSPNGFEFHNLYLDMNGIIHPCFHPEDSNEDFQPTSFKDVFSAIFDYVDRLFNIVRPRKLIFFAIDGVAPRAKMNQQRARRFQSAKSSEIGDQEEDRLRSKYEREGKKLLPKVKSELDDSNIITPGTEFMYELSKALQGYIQTSLKENPAWKTLKVILSDSNVPGEGEHKIMSFIRSQRSLPDYDVNTRHCLHGLDADLIMLALATHELHFSILREDVLGVKEEQPLSITSSNEDRDASSSKPFPVKKCCPYQFLHVWILREYLELDMQPFDAPEGFNFDIERAVDDFVFMCFFVGNDFLPRLPSLEIREGALDLLMTVYKRDFKSLGGYLVNAERINEPNGAYLKLKRIERLVLSVGSYEDHIFQKRAEIREHNKRKIMKELSSRDAEADEDIEDNDIPIVGVTSAFLNARVSNADSVDEILENTKQMKEDLRKHLRDEGDVFKTGQFPPDKIKYGTSGWKERYYKEKFATDDHLKLESIKKEVVKEYTEGLCWVLLYYYSGVPSWTWFYPFHYGPCASDLKGFGQHRVKFQEGKPFEPFDQLMAVLPPRSAEALPKAYRNLMMDAALAPFYPQDFKVDMDAKRFLWQGQCILPFIDEKLLLSYTRKAKQELKDYEKQRNLIKTDLEFSRASSGGEEDSSIVNIVCVKFSLPKPRIHVPRILENVKFPDRTIYETDIGETVLWHQQKGGSRTHRVPIQTRNCRAPPENDDTTSGLVSGSGWRGRGRGFSSQNPRQGVHNQHPNWCNSFENPRSPSGSNFRARPTNWIPVDHRATSFRPQGPMMMPAPPEFSSQNPRQGVHSQHPNRCNSFENPRSPSGANFRARPTNWIPVDHRATSFLPQGPMMMPAPPGFRPRPGNLNYNYNYPRSSNTSTRGSLSSCNGPRAHTHQMVGHFGNLSVSPSTPEGHGFGRGRGRGHGSYASDYPQGSSSRGGRGRGQFRPSQPT